MNTEQLESSTDELQPGLEEISIEEADKSVNENEALTDIPNDSWDNDNRKENIEVYSQSSKEDSLKQDEDLQEEDSKISSGPKSIQYDREVRKNIVTYVSCSNSNGGSIRI